METMDDFRDELEATLKKIRVGDVVTGTVIDVTEDSVLVDLKSYADGVIRKEDLSEDPDFNMMLEIHPGDEITATVMATNDGEGNMVLSKREANAVLAWDKLKKLMEDRTVVKVKISEVVNAGAIAYLEGIRGFIPASRLSDEYVEDLSEWNGKTVDVTVITADEETRRLVLSGREAAREKKQEETSRKIAKCEVGAVMKGTVETLKDYGAFVTLENGLTGLLHISQISTQRIKHPGVVLKEGQEVTVKILSTENNRISLSMKVLAEEQAEAESHETFDYKEEGQASTGLGALLRGLKLN
ncbi:MAG: S1 RNA-binding domain-containing protein [Lachnospiraceae bacterium]|nr:S1 RNA-binding domain-containing protein [Lachnospiraceae bacterium]